MKKAPLVMLKFLDHMQCSGDNLILADTVLVGFLVKEDKRAYYICSWMANGTLDHNADCYAIVKHKGLKIRRLK